MKNCYIVITFFVVVFFIFGEIYLGYSFVDNLVRTNFVAENKDTIKNFMCNFQDYGATILTIFSIVVATLMIAIQQSFTFINEYRKKYLLSKDKEKFLIKPNIATIFMFMGFLLNIVVLILIIFSAYNSFYLNDEILKLKTLFYFVIYSIFLIFAILVSNMLIFFISNE